MREKKFDEVSSSLLDYLVFLLEKGKEERSDYNVVKYLVPKLVKTTMSQLVVKKIYYEILWHVFPNLGKQKAMD